MIPFQRLKVTSHLLYESVADKINYVTFFRDFNLPNTFNSWFLVTELHVWLLLMRSMAEGSETGEDGRFLRNCIVEAMWGDVNTRAKKLGVGFTLVHLYIYNLNALHMCFPTGSQSFTHPSANRDLIRAVPSGPNRLRRGHHVRRSGFGLRLVAPLLRDEL